MPELYAEFILLVEMLERVGAALHLEAKAKRVSRHNIGANANNVQMISKNLRRLYEPPPTQGGTES